VSLGDVQPVIIPTDFLLENAKCLPSAMLFPVNGLAESSELWRRIHPAYRLLKSAIVWRWIKVVFSRIPAGSSGNYQIPQSHDL
jgi:hypothetical protein